MPKLPQVLLATAAALCAVDAASGQGLRRLPASKAEGQQFGSTLAALGDLDGDGSSELAVGAQRSGPGQPGFVSVLSGTNGRVLYTLHGLLRDDRFGRSLSGGLDLDGDAVPDLVVGASTSASASRACRAATCARTRVGTARCCGRSTRRARSGASPMRSRCSPT